MDYDLTQHARDVLIERNISVQWLERVFHAPEKAELDPDSVQLEHRLGKIIEHGNRVLRVVVNK